MTTAALPAEDVASWERDGILAPYPVLTEAQIAAALRTVAAIDAQPSAIRSGLLLHKSHLVSKTLGDLCKLPAILDRVEALLGPDILVWGANFFLKEPHSTAYVSWHQDAAYWGLDPADIVTAWVALTPSTLLSGCLRVVPGSHRWPIVEHVDTHAADNLLSRGQEIAVDVDPAQIRTVPLAPGEMSMHHVRIAHNSEPNRADHRRIGFAIRYVAAHVRPATRDPAMLVRGRNAYEHFSEEQPGAGELLPEDLARHAASRGGSRLAQKN